MHCQVVSGQFSVCGHLSALWRERERERERGSLRVAFPSLGQIMKTTVFDDVLEVLMSFTVKKLMVPDSERSI